MGRVLFTTSGNSGYQVIPKGSYDATVEKIEEDTVHSKYSGKDEQRLRWRFKIESDDEEHDGTLVDGMTSLATGPRSKLRQWVRAFYGDVEEGSGFDLDEIEGQSCKIQVTHSKTLRDDGQPWCNVSSVFANDSSPVLEVKSRDDDTGDQDNEDVDDDLNSEDDILMDEDDFKNKEESDDEEVFEEEEVKKPTEKKISSKKLKKISEKKTSTKKEAVAVASEDDDEIDSMTW